jgi:maltooligosyltrehalose trehalohydrolase
MDLRERGYFDVVLEDVEPGALYLYRLDGERERPDPASRSQPLGVHGPSQVIDPRFDWQDGAWQGLPLQQYILYELHVGAFTPEGTFEAVIPHLRHLTDLGIMAVELMPVAQFPGSRNWGYDGVYPFAAQNTYGGPPGLKRLVDACHRQGLAVVLDVVHNHLGPEGNYFTDFGPYFTDRYKTPWGPGLNFDGPESDEVRRFFLESALYWIGEFHVDALRPDAIHAILDHSAFPFLEELGEAIHRHADASGRRIYAIPESALNDPRIIRPRESGGFGLDAQWNDDFHHALRTLLTGDRAGYYRDFGEFAQLVKAYREGFVYSGEYSPFRRRRHGVSSRAAPAYQFVVFSHNHDHVGNRMLGERLCHIVSFEDLKLVASLVLLSPFIPLLFMGEEYGETAPFLYFVSHSDPALIEAVRRGRKEEFAAFAWLGEPPDPQAEETFLRSKLNHHLCDEGQHRTLLSFYKELVRLRKDVPALALLSKDHMEVVGLEEDVVLCVRRWSENDEVLSLFCLGRTSAVTRLPVPAGRWRKLLDSSEQRWLGGGGSTPQLLESGGAASVKLNPRSVVSYRREQEL